MKRTLSLLSTLLFLSGGACLTLNAQTPSPTPIPIGGKYQSDTYTLADRISDANALIALPTTSAAENTLVSAYMESLVLSSATPENWNTACPWTVLGESGPRTYSQLAAAIVTAKGALPAAAPVASRSDLLSRALLVQIAVLPTNLAKVNAWKAVLPKFSAADFVVNDAWQGYVGLNTHYAIDVLAAANDYKATGDHAAALQLLSDPILSGTNQWVNAIGAIASEKYLTRSSDALSWAKLYYLTVGFNDSQAGINMVTAALKAADLNLGRANEFISSQNAANAVITDTTGANAVNPAYKNVLQNVALPPAYASGLPHPEFAPMVDAVIKSNVKLAISQGLNQFLAANDNDSLNLSIAEVARALRDNDLNLVRANGFIAAQKAGQTYGLAEMQ